MAGKLIRRASMTDVNSSLGGMKVSTLRRSIFAVQAEPDVGEMGYLQFHVKDLQNVSDEKMDLKEYRVLFTIDFVADNYSKVKTMVAKGEDGRMGLWGTGLYFRVFNANKEVSLEIKATASNSSRDATIDFGSNRLSLVPALDAIIDRHWCVMQDRFGRRNSCRIQVSWRYVPKLNRVRPSILRKAIPTENNLLFTGSDPVSAEPCPPLQEMIERLCSEGPAIDDKESMANILSLSRSFMVYRDSVFSLRLSRFLNNNGQICESETMVLGKILLMKRRAEFKAALKLQRIFRGHIGRVLLHFAKLSKRAYMAMLEVQAVRSQIHELELKIFEAKAHEENNSNEQQSKLISERNDLCDVLGDKICAEQDIQLAYAKDIHHFNAYANLIDAWSPKFHGKTYREHKAEEKRLQSFEQRDENTEEHQSMPQQLPGIDHSAIIRGRFRRAGTVLFIGSMQRKKKSSINSAIQKLQEALQEIADVTKLDMEGIDFERNPPPGAQCFIMKPCPSLSIREQDRTIALVRARQALYAFLSEQIQKGAGILRTLDPVHESLNPDDVLRLTDIATLHCVDPGQVLFEQNEDADSFGIVCAGFIRVLYNRREVSTLIKGQSFCDTGMISHIMPSVFGPAKYVRGATFIAAVRSFVVIFNFDRFTDHVKGLGLRCEQSLKTFLSQSDSIGREDWSAYGNSAKSIEISFLFFMSTRSGLLGQLNMEEVRALASCATYSKIKTNEFLCKQGERADGIFIILTGVSAVIVDGKQVAVISRGQEVGEMGLIGHFGRLRSATLQALYDCEVANISYENFMSFIEILSEHQAKRLAAYVASTALPKYLSNLNLRKASEKEQEVERQRRAAMRRLSPDGRMPRRRMSIVGPQSENHRPEPDPRRRISLEGYSGRYSRGEDGEADLLHERSNSFCRQSPEGRRSPERMRSPVRRRSPSESRIVAFQKDDAPSERFKLRRALTEAPASEAQDIEASKRIWEDFRRQGSEKSMRQASARSLNGERLCSEIGDVAVNPVTESQENKENCDQHRIVKDELSEQSQEHGKSSNAPTTLTFDQNETALHVTYDPNIKFKQISGAIKNASDSLTDSARTNVRNKLKREMGQIYLLPPKKPIQGHRHESTNLCSSPLSKRLCKNQVAKHLNAGQSDVECMEKIRMALKTNFTDMTDAWASFDSRGKGQINVEHLTVSLKKLGVDSLPIMHLLGKLKHRIHQGGICRADLTKLLSWHQNERNTPEILLSYTFPKVDNGDILSCKNLRKLFLDALEKKLSVLKQIFAKEGDDSSESITLESFKENLLLLDIGMSQDEIADALGLLGCNEVKTIQFSDVLRWIAEHISTQHDKANSASPCRLSSKQIADGTAKAAKLSAREWHASTKTEAVAHPRQRPQTARARLSHMKNSPGLADDCDITSASPKRRPQTAKARIGSQAPNTVPHDKELVTALWRKGQMHALEGRHEEAACLLRQALSVDPNNLNCLDTYAQVLCEGLEDYAEAVQVFEKMLEIEPRDSKTLSKYATLLLTLKQDRDRARRLFETAIKYDSMSAALLCGYADFLARGGMDAGPERDKRVLALYERAVAIDRQQTGAKEASERLRAKLGATAPPPPAVSPAMTPANHLSFAVQLHLSA